MTRSDIEEAVRQALGEVVPEARLDGLDPVAPLRDQIEIDSLDYLNFIMVLETHLDLVVPPTSYPLFATIAGAVAAIEELMAARSASGA